jgi:hypothetical protein
VISSPREEILYINERRKKVNQNANNQQNNQQNSEKDVVQSGTATPNTQQQPVAASQACGEAKNYNRLFR